MNRSDKARAIVVFEELAAALRTELYGEAAAEHAEGSTPTWRMGDVTVSSALSNPTAAIDDQEAFLAFVREAHPSEVETIVTETTRVRPSFTSQLIKWIAKAGVPCDQDGRVVPGVRYLPGGELRSISVKPTAGFKADATTFALEVAAGQRHLTLPAIGADAMGDQAFIDATATDTSGSSAADVWDLTYHTDVWAVGSAVLS